MRELVGSKNTIGQMASVLKKLKKKGDKAITGKAGGAVVTTMNVLTIS